MIRRLRQQTFLRRKSFRRVYGVCFAVILSVFGAAQKGGQGAAAAGTQGAQTAQASQGTGAGGAQGLQGLSYSPDQWMNLRLPDVKGPNWTFKEGRAVVCYRLVKGNSAAQPFVLESISKSEVIGSGFYRPCGDDSQGETDSEGQKVCKHQAAKANRLGPEATHWSPCSELKSAKSPILMNEILVVGVDVSDLGAMGINIDQVKLLNINVTNQLGASINPSPVRPSFPATSAAGGGGGSAGMLGAPLDTTGKGNFWIPLGTHAPEGTFPQTWHPDISYLKGAIVSDSNGTHFFMANRDFKTSDGRPALGKIPGDPFPPEPRVERIADGDVIWQEMDDPKKDIGAFNWAANTRYSSGSAVCVPRDANDAITTIGVKALRNMATIDRLAIQVQALDPKIKDLFVANDLRRFSAFVSLKIPTESSPVFNCRGFDNALDALKDLSNPQRRKSAQEYLNDAANFLGNGEEPDLVAEQNLLRRTADELATLPGVPQKDSPVAKDVESVKSALRHEHFHYYYAVKGGESGTPPLDPLSYGMVQRAIYLAWPYELQGDMIPTFNVNLVYSPPTPGAPWQGNTFYPAGSVVISSRNQSSASPTIGHYYTALTGGFSSPEPDEPIFPGDVPPTYNDGTLVWLDAGTSAPTISATPGVGSVQSGGGGGGQGSGGGGQGGGGGQAAGGGASKAQIWFPNTHYLLGDVILNPDNGHYYTVVKLMGGFSGPSPSAQGNLQPTTATPPTDPFPSAPGQAEILTDGQVQWMQTNTPKPAPKAWMQNHPYTIGQVMTTHGESYVMTASTNSEGTSLAGPLPLPVGPTEGSRIQDNQIFWMYAPNGSANQEWQPSTKYSVGTSVFGGSNHVFVMVGTTTGQSGMIDPTIQAASAPLLTVTDGDLLWGDLGPRASLPQYQKWLSAHNYVIGESVSASNGHDYRVVRFISGTSGPAPQSPFPSGTPGNPPQRRVADGTIVWAADSSPPDGFWKPNTPFGKGFVVSPPEDASQTWKAMNAGSSGVVPVHPVFPVLESHIIIEPSSDAVTDGTIFWADLGVVRPPDLPAGSQMTWRPGNQGGIYQSDDIIFVPRPGGGRYYQALNSGTAGDKSPFLAMNAPLPLTWQDSGATAPASVASGQPPDQTVSLINLTLPQTHSLSYFNISAGVIVDFKRPPVFGFVPATASSVPGYTPAPPTATNPSSTNIYSVNAASGCTVGSITTGTPPSATTNNYAYECPALVSSGPHPVDPVLVLTGYIPPIDAEKPLNYKGRAWWRDVLPGPSVGLSLANPTTNFYVGGSTEFPVRNMQVFFGLAFHSISTRLSPGSTQPLWGGTGTAPAVATVSTLQKGFFLGMTFNLSGFVQTLLGGGGGAK
jgi:hypothetical protein